MLPEKDSVLEKPPHFDPNNIILCFYAALYAATYLLPNFVQEMLGYTATTSGMVFSPADLCTMIEVPFVGYVLTRDYDPRKMIFFGLVVVASSFLWMSSLNLGIAERDIILPRIVQVLGAGIITAPVSTIIFRFFLKTDSSQAAGLYALMRNEGGSIGIALVSTMLQRKAQVHQQITSLSQMRLEHGGSYPLYRRIGEVSSHVRPH